MRLILTLISWICADISCPAFSRQGDKPLSQRKRGMLSFRLADFRPFCPIRCPSDIANNVRWIAQIHGHIGQITRLNADDVQQCFFLGPVPEP